MASAFPVAAVIADNKGAIAEAAGFPADAVGVASGKDQRGAGVLVDTSHVWWDAALASDIARAGERIVSYQVCDWILRFPLAF